MLKCRKSNKVNENENKELPVNEGDYKSPMKT